ncbi:ArsR/SmtB family transcription factor [Neobacillus mesonae]|uniref:ArsR/SmtB family transcription factor n=1 Tax=Neobacillus mesonae TaxID=1193713 RepID=UPI00082EC269|nr:metalloregulator ArsR/SmtB family transcription factor [Neobacillus mesonae]MED4207533.1 metalloregulator ArsR/SmtB family transcription factor [Neobacillus mesonae]
MKKRSNEETAKILKLLGDKTRLSMMGLLMNHDCCVCEFVELFKMSQPAISQHLRKLKDAGLVNEQKRGQWVFYSLNRQNTFFPLVDDVLKHVPDQEEKINLLAQKGLRITCN